MKSDSPGTDPVIERQYYLAWLAIKGVGPQQLLKIRDHFGSFFVAWTATHDLDPLWQAWLQRTKQSRQSIDPELYFNKLVANNPQIVTLLDNEYPARLQNSYPHPVLYYRGSLDSLNNSAFLSVVGSRQLTNYHHQALRLVMAGLVGHQVVIVSGLAFGADALAHELALEYSLPTIAVLGSAVDDASIYPRSNFSLAQRILKSGGLMLSPFAAGSAIDKHNFPLRNTIIAGLSPVTLVACAAQRSGALITAQLALDVGHEVLTIPGPITDTSSVGTNALLRQGALAITSSEELLQALNLTTQNEVTKKSYTTSDPLQHALVTTLTRTPYHYDDLLAQHPTATPTQVTVALAQMELQGWIERLPGNVIRLR